MTSLLFSILCVLVLASCGSSCEHDWVLVSNTATCENSGIKTYSCSKCHEEKTENSIAKGHNWSVTSDTATCTEAGTMTYTCSNCKKTKSESSPAKGHDYDSHDDCKNCGEYKFNISFTNSIPCVAGYSRGSSSYYSKFTINYINFTTSSGYLTAVGQAKKTYDWKGESGSSVIAFKIKIVCTTDDEVVGLIEVYEWRTKPIVGQVVSFYEESDISTYSLSASKTYTATIFDY